MVVTDLLLAPYKGRPDDWSRARRIFNILADEVETVAPWLADRVLDNKKNGATIAYSSTWKTMVRFLLAPLRKRDLFAGLDAKILGGGELTE
jgi:hypothetical protein